jgi:hypothetical protein
MEFSSIYVPISSISFDVRESELRERAGPSEGKEFADKKRTTDASVAKSMLPRPFSVALNCARRPVQSVQWT